MANPVSVCMIVKNEVGQIEACLKSLRPHVAEIVVVDTGSTDGTPEIVRGLADVFEVFTGCNDSQGRIADFSIARQRSFDLATQPWVMWVDGDDEVVGADRIGSLIEAHDKTGSTAPVAFLLPYEYSQDDRGNVTCLHYRERICKPKDAFQWIGPVHEVYAPKVGADMIKTDEVRIVHKRQTSGKVGEPGRNLRILQAYYEKHGDGEVRQLYYLGLEYANSGDLRKSIEFHKKYVSRSGWDDEKCLSCLEVAKHHQTFGEYDEAIEWALRATTVKERWGETYFSLGKSYYFLAMRGGPDSARNWERAVNFFQLGLSMPPTDTILFVNPLERAFEVHKFMNLALNSLGRVEEALHSANMGLQVYPDDQGLRSNATLYEEYILKHKIEQGLSRLLTIGKLDEGSALVIKDTLRGRMRPPVPAEAPVVPAPVQAAPPPPPPPPASPGALDIVFYVGGGSEPWNPEVFGKSGIGGSETMAWEMAKHLAALGHSVRLYGDCQHIEGTFEGVQFLHHERYKDVSCDVLISSRRPTAVDDAYGSKARMRMLWVHDVHCGDSLTHARALRFDRILTLSEWHKSIVLSRYPYVNPCQVLLTRNGIDLSRFAGTEVRNPHRAIFSSSPDRGVQVAVDAMAKIRQRVPDAELHVFYGFKNWESAARSYNDAGQLELIKHLKRLIEANRVNGVHYHDRVDQKTLAREFMRSGVWAYPTWFTETSCITAMEAQAAGLRIVTSPIAALNETVAGRGTMIRGADGRALDWLSPEYMDQFVDAVVSAMLDDRGPDRDQLIAHARANFGLETLAAEWDVLIRTALAEVERDVVPPYRVVA